MNLNAFRTISKAEQDSIGIHFSEWSRAGVTRLWTGISDLNENYPKPDPNCNFKYQDTSQLYFTNYADSDLRLQHNFFRFALKQF